MRSTYTATPSDIEAKWFVVDADGMVLGRLATEVARIIRGKHKSMFTPHMDTGDNVIYSNGVGRRGPGRAQDAAGCAGGGLRCSNPAAPGRFAGAWVGAAGSRPAPRSWRSGSWAGRPSLGGVCNAYSGQLT